MDTQPRPTIERTMPWTAHCGVQQWSEGIYTLAGLGYQLRTFTPTGHSCRLTPAIWALYTLLPPPGAHWPAEQRRAWLALARGIFAFVYGQETPEYTAPEVTP